MSGSDDYAPWVVIGGLGLVAAADLIAWTTGGVLTVLAGEPWPDVPLSPLAQLQAALAGEKLWPHVAPAMHVGVSTLLGVLVLGPLLHLAIRLWSKVERDRKDRQLNGGKSQAWATARNLRDLIVQPGSGRLVLGMLATAKAKVLPLIAARPQHALLVIGPTQSGKSSGVAVPVLLEHDGPAVVTSVKTDLVDDTAGARQVVGSVWVYDPTGQTGLPSASWTPLRRCLSPAGAAKQASSLVRLAGVTGGTSDETWSMAAADLGGPLLHAAAIGGYSVGDVLRWVRTKKMDVPLEVLDGEAKRRRSSTYADMAETVRAVMSDSDRLRDSILFTLRTSLAAFGDPQVLTTATRCDWTPEALLSGSHTLYLVGASSEQKRLAPVMLAILDEIREAAYAQAAERHAATGRYLDEDTKRLLWLEDEAANIARSPDKAAFVSTAGGMGITAVSIFHDLSQLRAVYGRDEAGTIASNHVAKLLLPGVTDEETLDYFEEVIGDERVLETSTSRKAGERRTTSTSSRSRAILAHREGRELGEWEAVLLYGSRKPARLRLRPYFEDERLEALMQPFRPGWLPPRSPEPETRQPRPRTRKDRPVEAVPEPQPVEVPVEEPASPAAVTQDVIDEHVAVGQAERIGTTPSSPVWWQDQFWHRTKDGTGFEPVVDARQIEALRKALDRWRGANTEEGAA